MQATLTYFGVSTFRLDIDGKVLFLDTFVDRAPDAPPVGLRSDDVEEADFLLIGHSHFDHALGADVIAKNTGAVVVGSYETARIMADEHVPEEQIMAVAGGELIEVSERVSVRVFPAQHSCRWAQKSRDPSECFTGELGVSLQEQRRQQGLKGAVKTGTYAGRGYESVPWVRGDGGALAFVIQTPDGDIWWNDTSGFWTDVAASQHPQIAIVAAAGRGNVDGDPFQGSLAEYVAQQVRLLQPQTVILCHHDNWYPGFTNEMDIRPIVGAIQEQAGHAVQVIDPAYGVSLELQLDSTMRTPRR